MLLRLPFDALEIDELCISKKRNLWLWVASSRYSGQVIGFAIGDRSFETLERLWYSLPECWRKKLVYTDNYGVYRAFFWPWQHRICQKGDGGTSTAEGVNNSLRHRNGALARKTSARCRCPLLWDRRIALTVQAHNRQGLKRLNRRRRETQRKR